MRSYIKIFFLTLLVFMFTPIINAGITYQPDILPEIGFNYDTTNYAYTLTYKQYYLTIQPYAVYDGQFYTLKQIVPFIKNNYPSVTYRQTIERFAKYQRWGYWLENLPVEISSKLEAVGYRLINTNIPLSAVEYEHDKELNISRLEFKNGFTLDFSDLEARYDVKINRTHIEVTGITGLADIDMDPITYSAPTITVTGTNGGSPWTFWDIWNASNVNGWDVIYNNNETNIQYTIKCQLVIGDSGIATTFTDTGKQIYLDYNINYPINIKTGATVTFGELLSTRGYNGIQFKRSSAYSGTQTIRADDSAVVYYYACIFVGDTSSNKLGVQTVGGEQRDCFFGKYSFSSYVGTLIRNTYKTYNIPNNYGRTYTNCSFIHRDPVTPLLGTAIYSDFINCYFYNLAKFANIYGSADGRIYEWYDCIFDETNYLIQWSSSTGGNAKFYYSIETTIKNNLGTPIENASVFVYNNTNNIIYNYTTNNNGRSARNYTKVYEFIYPNTTPSNAYPFRLHVEAEGYQDYDIYNITLTAPVSWEITLTDSQPEAGINILVIAIALIGLVIGGALSKR